jgi:hypothetical protein
MKFPNLPEDLDKRKRLTVRRMVQKLLEYGFSYRELGKILGVSYTLFGKYKLTPEEARKKRYKYNMTTGNNAEYRRRIRAIHGDKLLEYERLCQKKYHDKNRKNKFTPRGRALIIK